METSSETRPRRRQLGAILVGTGIISREHLTVALIEQMQAGHRERLGEILVRQGRLGMGTLRWALSQQ